MKDIEKLMKKYWEGETSIEEERIIKNHFSKRDDKITTSQDALFSYFENEKQIKYEGTIKISNEPKVVRMPLYKKIAIAASIIFIIGFGLLTTNYLSDNNSAQYAKNEINDPNEARQIAENALAMLAANFNKGEKSISKNINNLDKLNIIQSIKSNKS